jgi:hypothetical protein
MMISYVSWVIGGKIDRERRVDGIPSGRMRRSFHILVVRG